MAASPIRKSPRKRVIFEDTQNFGDGTEGPYAVDDDNDDDWAPSSVGPKLRYKKADNLSLERRDITEPALTPRRSSRSTTRASRNTSVPEGLPLRASSAPAKERSRSSRKNPNPPAAKASTLEFSENSVAKMRGPSSKKWKDVSLKDFKSYTPTRLSLDFDILGGEYDDGWYELEFSHLSLALLSTFKKYFDNEGKQAGWHGAPSPWLRKFPPQFYQYAEMVARPEGATGNWDTLLENQIDRNFLVGGIFVKFLEMKVFSDLLFGASKAQKDILLAQDGNLLTSDSK
jgi:hypothetical protein